MLKRVDPLRNELKSLESQADENKHRAEDIIKVRPISPPPAGLTGAAVAEGLGA